MSEVERSPSSMTEKGSEAGQARAPQDGVQLREQSGVGTREDAVAGSILRVLRVWHRLDASVRDDLLDDLSRRAHYYVKRDGEIPKWLHSLLWEVTLRQRELEYSRPPAES